MAILLNPVKTTIVRLTAPLREQKLEFTNQERFHVISYLSFYYILLVTFSLHMRGNNEQHVTALNVSYLTHVKSYSCLFPFNSVRQTRAFFVDFVGSRCRVCM